MAEPIKLDEDQALVFTPEQLQEITGYEKPFESQDELKEFFEKVKTEKEVVKETVPFEFKDDFIKGAYEYYERFGDLAPYIQNNVDYSAVEAKDLIKIQFKRENEGLSESAINHLVKKELEKYELPEDASEEDKNLQKELLDVRVNKIRGILTEEQKKFNAPENPAPSLEEWAGKVNESDVTKGLLTEKTITFGDGESAFNLEVTDPQQLVDMTIDNTKFFQIFFDDKGEMNMGLWYKVLAYAKNPKEFEDLLVKHGQSIGTESVVKDIKNPELKLQGGKNETTEEDLLDAFAKRGKHVKRR